MVTELKTVIHIEEVSESEDSITYDTFLDRIYMGRTTSLKQYMNMDVYEYFKRERESIG